MMNNLLQVVLPEFKEGLKPFKTKHAARGKILLAFENGFLSIESGEVRSVMRAQGNWEGRAVFSGEILRALATVPPAENPVTIGFAQGRLLISGMTIPCEWTHAANEAIASSVAALTDPSIIDLLAMNQYAQRVKLGQSGIASKIRSAQLKMERRIKSASAQLIDLNITEAEIRSLVNSKIQARIESENKN